MTNYSNATGFLQDQVSRYTTLAINRYIPKFTKREAELTNNVDHTEGNVRFRKKHDYELMGI